jgi:hypothetical protein
VVAVRSWPTLPAAVHGEDAGHRGRLARAAAEGRAGHAGAAKRATAPAVQEEGATSSDGIRRRLAGGGNARCDGGRVSLGPAALVSREFEGKGHRASSVRAL